MELKLFQSIRSNYIPADKAVGRSGKISDDILITLEATGD